VDGDVVYTWQSATLSEPSYTSASQMAADTSARDSILLSSTLAMHCTSIPAFTIR
jgi:hypothetical protein